MKQQLNYTRRVNRPRGRELSAYRNVSDSTNISYGNPRLSPEFANALELNYIKSWEEHVLSASLYYRYTTDVIQQVRFESPLNNDIMETTYENIASAQSVGFEIVGYFFETELKGALERNHLREGKACIPEVGIRATAQKFEPPHYAEGFDALYKVRILGQGEFSILPIQI
jgi:hypothetical protein